MDCAVESKVGVGVGVGVGAGVGVALGVRDGDGVAVGLLVATGVDDWGCSQMKVTTARITTRAPAMPAITAPMMFLRRRSSFRAEIRLSGSSTPRS